MIEFHLNQATMNLKLLDEQVGKPAVPNMPQTTNQAVIVIMRDLLEAVKLMQLETHGIT